MKKLIMISLLIFTSSLFANTSIGVRIQAPIGNNGVINIGVKSDDHRYAHRYKNFNYKRNGYYDDYGYYFGYFDKVGYFYNNIFFTYNSRYTYRDRLKRRGNFSPKHAHFRPYKYHKGNDWNKSKNYRKQNQPIYGKYYEKEQYTSKHRYNDNVKRKNPSQRNQSYEIKQEKHYKKYNKKTNQYYKEDKRRR